MEIKQIANSLHKAGFLKANGGFEYVPAFLKVVDGNAYAILMVDCDKMPNMDVLQYENFLRTARSTLYEYEFDNIHLLGVLCTNNPESVKELVAGFGEHWVVDMVQRRLLIYENQVLTYLDAKEAIEKALLFENEDMANEVERYQRHRQLLKNNWCSYMLVAINLIVFLVLSVFGDTENADFMAKYGALNTADINHGFWYYQIITSIFLHFGVAHLMNNMFSLLIYGNFVEKHMNKFQYLFIYLGAGIIGSIVSAVYYYSFHIINTVCAGASGAIFGLLGAMLWLVIIHKGELDGLGWRQLLFLVFLSIYIGLADSSVGNAAHIGGFVGGILLSMIVLRNKN